MSTNLMNSRQVKAMYVQSIKEELDLIAAVKVSCPYLANECHEIEAELSQQMKEKLKDFSQELRKNKMKGGL